MSIYGNPVTLGGSDGGGTSLLWQTFKAYVDAGTASARLPVGSQITDVWKGPGNRPYIIPWDIVHYDASGNAYLRAHYAPPILVPFDEREALYAFDGTESAGVEYYIEIKYAYGTGWVLNDGIAFTLSSAPASGDQFVVEIESSSDNPTNTTWKVYGAGSTTVKQSGATRNSKSGTKLAETSSTANTYTNGRVNAPPRCAYGYVRWSESALHQWLNSSAAAGQWWQPKNIWDRPPAIASTSPGFIAGVSDSLAYVKEQTQVVTTLDPLEGFVSTYETTNDYFWVPSLTEMYVEPVVANVSEGVAWDYFKNLAQESELQGKFQRDVGYPLLINYSADDMDTPVFSKLRTPTDTSIAGPFTVGEAGNIYGRGGMREDHLNPAFRISKA